MQKADEETHIERHTLDDSRAHNGLMTFTDHELVRAKMNIPRLNIKKENKYGRVNIEELLGC